MKDNGKRDLLRHRTGAFADHPRAEMVGLKENPVAFEATVMSNTPPITNIIENYKSSKLTNLLLRNSSAFYGSMHLAGFFDKGIYKKTLFRTEAQPISLAPRDFDMLSKYFEKIPEDQKLRIHVEEFPVYINGNPFYKDRMGESCMKLQSEIGEYELPRPHDYNFLYTDHVPRLPGQFM